MAEQPPPPIEDFLALVFQQNTTGFFFLYRGKKYKKDTKLGVLFLVPSSVRPLIVLVLSDS